MKFALLFTQFCWHSVLFCSQTCVALSAERHARAENNTIVPRKIILNLCTLFIFRFVSVFLLFHRALARIFDAAEAAVKILLAAHIALVNRL